MSERNYTIDFLRFLAAFWVALFHFNEPYVYIHNWYRNLIKLGHLGVPVFFVISGYCIMVTAYRSKNSWDFISRRFFRIFPTYWVSLLVVLVVIFVQKIITGFNSVTILPKTIEGISATIVLLTDPVTSIKTINWVYWSLSFEVFFYLIIAISLLFKDPFRLLFLLFISLLGFLENGKSGTPLFFLQHWPTFALGLCLYLLCNKMDFKNRISFILLLIVNLAVLFKHFGLHHQKDYLITALISVSLIFASNYYSIKPNFFSRMGDYSYSVYLVHVPIGCYLLGKLKIVYIQQNVTLNILFDLLIYSIISFAAYFIFRAIEKPSIEIGKKFSKKFFDSPARVIATTKLTERLL